MSDRSINYVPTFPSFFSKLFYSNALGIMRSPDFSIRDYKEDNFVLIVTHNQIPPFTRLRLRIGQELIDGNADRTRHGGGKGDALTILDGLEFLLQ